jgi:hypothetical protein
MTARFHRVQGDIGDTLVTELDGVTDFTAATAVANVWLVGTTPTSLAATVANAVATDGTPCGRCTVVLGSWLTTALGNYLLEYTVTFSNGAVLTWPADAPDMLIIRADA